MSDDRFSRESLTHRLGDGRLLGYAEYGDPAGTPIVFFHGTPSSRLMFRVGDEAARSASVRLIAPDRPGIGLSTHKPGRRIADWPADVVSLADALGLKHFSVVGISGGGPYAMACATFIPERLSSMGAVSGMGPLDHPVLFKTLTHSHRAIFALARAGGIPYSMFCRAVAASVRRWPASILASTSGKEPSAERKEIKTTEAWHALKAASVEAFRGGSQGPGHDVHLLATPWGFVPDNGRVRTFLWHGNADTIVPAAMTHHLAERMQDCEISIIPGAGHFWGLTNAAIIIGAMTSVRQEAA